MKDDLILAVVLAAMVIGAAYYAKKKVADAVQPVLDTASDLWGSATSAANTGAQAAVYPVADTLGIPRTNMTACQQAIADGRTLDASFACPALDFIKYLAQ